MGYHADLPADDSQYWCVPTLDSWLFAALTQTG